MKSLFRRTKLAAFTATLSVVTLVPLSTLAGRASADGVADLRAVSSNGASAEPSVGPVLDVTTARSNTVRNADGSLTATVYSEPVNYKAADGSWQPIDNTLVDADGAAYAVQNAAGPYTAKLPDDPETTPVRFSADGAGSPCRCMGLAARRPLSTARAPRWMMWRKRTA